MKVLIIVPYFGKWPLWIEYFLESCRYNPEFNWLLISNSSKPQDLPNNVNYIKSSLSEFNSLASSRLEMNINVIYPYKLCDLKPAYGEIFKEHINGYDFWGYSDIDLIYGKIKNFITESILKNYELITVRNEYLAGHFTLYKNAEKTNTLYKKSNMHQVIFEDSKHHYAFDERTNYYGGNLKIKTFPKEISKILLFWIKIFNKIRLKFNPKMITELNDMTKISFHEERTGNIKFYHKKLILSNSWFKQRGITNWKVNWENGILKESYNNKELLHFHFIGLKRNKDFTINTFKSNNKICITPHNISNN